MSRSPVPQQRLTGQYIGLMSVFGMLFGIGTAQAAIFQGRSIAWIGVGCVGAGVVVLVIALAMFIRRGDELQSRMILEAVAIGSSLAGVFAAVAGAAYLACPHLRGHVALCAVWILPLWATGFGLGMAVVSTKRGAR